MRQFFQKPAYIAATVIVAFLILLRFWQIDSVPVSLFGDEIDVGLQAYSVAQTGKDYFGNKLPVLFHSFAEYRLPMQLYLDVPFVKFLGLNEIGVRMPAILMGVISIVSLYFLAKEFFDKKVALIASVFIAASPWHFIYSRQANDAGILLPFIILGTLFFIKGVKEYKFLFASALFFSLGVYAYAISSLFIPLFVILLTILYRKKIFSYGSKKLVFVGLAAFIILSPYIAQSLKGRTTERFSYITVAPKKEVTMEVEAKRKWSNTTLSRVLDNKYTVVLEKIAQNYLKSYSFSFLFSDGDSNPRQSVGGYGLFYYYDLAFILIAIWAVVSTFPRLTDEKKKMLKLLGLWLLLAPLPSSLTEGGGTHASRLILILPPLVLLSALGFNSILERVKTAKGKAVLLLIILFMLYEATRFFHSYFVIWPKESWRYWHYGFKEMTASVKAHEADFDRVFLNNTYEPMMPRFIFWYGYDMGLFQKQFEDDKHIDGIYPGFNGFKLGDKYYFGELVKPIENLAKEGNLIVASAEKDVSNPGIFDNPNLTLLDIIYSPEHTPLFYIYSGSP
jgi:4-amino-4-deoxy-L-arabinose transferase-like glycosyltransferase